MKHYDYNAESVINAILEENLAPHLIEFQVSAVAEITESVQLLDVPEEIPKDVSKKSRTKYQLRHFLKSFLRFQLLNLMFIYPNFLKNLRTVHFDEMREVLDDKQNLKSLILEKVDNLLASEVGCYISIIFLIQKE